MTTGRYREEVFNVLLALLLHQRGVVSAPEQSFREAVSSHRHIPDVLVDFQGLRTVIEGKVDDSSQARQTVLAQARERVDRGIAHIGVAVLYPPILRQTPFAELLEALAHSSFSTAVCSEAGEVGWAEGNLDYLADLLRRTFNQLVKEDVVAEAVATLDAGITDFARSAFTMPATVQRAAGILGIGEPPKKTRKQAEDEE